MDIFAQEKRE